MISLPLFIGVAHSLDMGYSSILNQVAASTASAQTLQSDSPEEQGEQPISQDQEQRDFQARLDAIAEQMNRRLNGDGFTYRSGVALGKLIGTRSDEDESDQKATKTYRRVRQAALETSEKRSIEQFNLVVGPKVYLINSSEPKWDRFSLCGTGDRGYIVGATNTSQEVLIFDIQNYMLQTLGAASANLSAQLPPRRGQNNIATSCKYKSLTVITEDPAQGIYHQAIADAALSIAQYMAASYSAVNATFAGRAWRPISMQNGSAVAFAPIYGSQALLSYTNASGMFSTYGSAIYMLNAGDNPHREPISYTDGTLSILENRGNNTQLKVQRLNQNFVSFTPITINYNSTTIDPSIINQPYAPRTPLVNNKPITMITPADNYTSAALLTGTPNLGVMLSGRKLAPNSGVGPNGILSVANCADMPEINTYARDALEGANFVIKYDVVNASANSSSVIGGEQTFRDFTLLVPAQPQIACFDNGTVVVGFLEDGTPTTFTFNFLGHNLNSPTPTPSPNLLNNVTIDISIPQNIGTEFIPITGQIVAISNNTATIQIVDVGGYTIIYRINGSEVPLFTNFTPNEIYNFNFAANPNATSKDPFVIKGCDAEGHCSSSTAKTSIHDALSISGVNLALVIPLALLGVATVATIGGIVYVKIVRQTPWAKRAREDAKKAKKGEKPQDYDWNVESPEKKKADDPYFKLEES